MSKASLDTTVIPLISIIRNAGYEIFCNLERDNTYINDKWSAKQIMDECFAELDKSNYHIIFVAPNTNLGEGMLIELGYAKKMKIPTLLLLPDKYYSISTKAVVDNTIVYTDMTDLFQKLHYFNNNEMI